MTDRRVGARAGFTLAEILAATAIVAIGFVACATAFQQALAGIESGRRDLARQEKQRQNPIKTAHWRATALSISDNEHSRTRPALIYHDR